METAQAHSHTWIHLWVVVGHVEVYESMNNTIREALQQLLALKVWQLGLILLAWVLGGVVVVAAVIRNK
jgi:hypothetical protein